MESTMEGILEEEVLSEEEEALRIKKEREWHYEGGGINKAEGHNSFSRKFYVKQSDKGKIIDVFGIRDSYSTVLMYKTLPQQTSKAYGEFYMDFDIDMKKDSDFEKIRKDVIIVISTLKKRLGLTSDDMNIFFSGNKGFHVMVNPITLGIAPKQDLNVDFKLFARRLKSYTLYKTLDTVVYDKVRLMRINNTINGKSGLYKVKIDEEILRKYSYEEIKEYAKSPKEATTDYVATSITTEKASRGYRVMIEEQRKIDNKAEQDALAKRSLIQSKDLLPCLAYILDSKVEKGNRNNTVVMLASGMIQCGASENEIVKKINEWSVNNGKEKLPYSEIRNTVKSARRLFNEGKGYGCKSAQSLGYCIGSLCNLYKGEKIVCQIQKRH